MFLGVAVAYLALSVAIVAVELDRARRTGIGVITVFMFLFLLQCCFSGVVIFSLLGYADPVEPTTVPWFDRILSRVDLTTAYMVVLLTALFALFFYLGCTLGRSCLPSDNVWRAYPGSSVLRIRYGALSVVVGLGLALSLYSFWQMGDSIPERYLELIRFRGGSSALETGFLNSNSLAMTQTWSWLTVVALFACTGRRRARWLIPFLLIALVVLAILGVSRRALFLPVLLIYLSLLLHTGHWRLHWLAASAVPVFFIVVFGKNFLGALAFGGDIGAVATTYESWISGMLRGGAEVGSTLVESNGTLLFLQEGPRLGTDHLLSMLKLVPEQSLGFLVDYPERVVRISTEAFSHPGDADIPPGLMGQMWLDFRLFGPVVWGLVFGLQMSVVNFLYLHFRGTRDASVVFVMITFIVSMPINTGSYDFTFSFDVVFFAAFLAICTSVRRGHVHLARNVLGQKSSAS